MTVGDGTRVVSGSGDATLRIWDARSGVELASLKHLSAVEAVSHYGSGKIISSSRGALRFWDLDTYAEEARLLTHLASVCSIAPIPKSNLVACALQRLSVEIFDVESKTIRQLSSRGHTDLITSVIVANQGSWLVSAAKDGSHVVWSLDDGAVLRRLRGHSGAINATALVSNRQVISASNDADLILWDIETGEIIRRFRGHLGPVTSVAVTPHGYVVSGLSLIHI